jgi:magnesium transporter
MITAFVEHNGRARAVSDMSEITALAGRPAQDAANVWIDLEEPAEQELQAVGAALGLDPEAIEDCLYGQQVPRIDEFESCMFLMLYGMIGKDETAGFAPRKFAAFCGGRFLVTVQREALRSVHTIRERCHKNPAGMLRHGVDFVLYRIIDLMVDRYIHVADSYESTVEDLEDRALADEVDRSVLADASDLRLKILELRRLASSQRELLSPLSQGEYDYLNETLARRFSHVRDHLTRVIETVDAIRERLHTVLENYRARQADRLNEVIKTLTVFATILLPLSLIAGIYGMNVPLWPLTDHPGSFWGIMVVMLAVAVGMLAYFRRKGWV